MIDSIRGSWLAAVLLIAGMAGAAPGTLIFMPLDNISGEQSAYGTLAPLIVKTLESRGWKVVTGPDVERLLEQKRVRYFDSLNDDVRHEVITSANAAVILTVTIYTYSQDRNASIGLSARLVDAAGDTQWANVYALNASDTERALGLGKKETVAEIAPQTIDALLKGFPCATCEIRRRDSLPRAGVFKRALTFNGTALDRSRHVCILPFDNESSAPDAVRVVADVLALKLSAAGFRVVDPATLRAAALKARLSLHNVSSEELKLLAKGVGTSLFLRGTIYGFEDPTVRSASATPALDLETTLVDVETGKVLWAAQDDRKGTDYIGFLMLGAISNSVTLTDRVATEMVATIRINHDETTHSGNRNPVASLVRKQRQPNAGEGQR